MATVYTVTQNSDNSGDAGFTHREYVTPLATGSLGQVRITAQSSVSSGALTVDHVSIGVASGTGGNTVSTPVELLFSGAHGFAISQNSSITSDWANLTFLSTDNLVVIFDIKSGTSGQDGFRGASATSGNDIWHSAAASYAATTPPGGSTTSSGQTWIVRLIETQAGGGGGTSGSGRYLLETSATDGYQLEDGSGVLLLDDYDPDWFPWPDALDDTTEEGVFDEALWQPDNAPITSPTIIEGLSSEDTTEEGIFDDGLWDAKPADVAAVATTDVLHIQLSFFDLLDAVTESDAQPNLTEPAAVAVPDLIESFLSEDDFQPEEGLDLSQPGTFDEVAADIIVSLAAEDDFVPEEGSDLNQQASLAETDNLVTDGIVSIPSEDDFEPESGFDFAQSGPTDDAPNLVTDGIVALDAEDDFVPEEGVDLSQPGVTDQFLTPEIGWQDAEDDFVPEEGLDLVQPGSPEQFLCPEIGWLQAEDDFELETGLDFAQSGPTDVTLNLVTDGIVALDADDDFVEEGGLDLSLSGPTDDAAAVTATDVLEYSLSFYDLTDLVTESFSQSHLTEDGAPGFDGTLTDVLYDFEERVPTDFAQPNLTEPAVTAPVDPSFNLVLSFFDLTDLVTESLSQSHLTEAAPVIPDLIESFLSEDDFVPEEGLDLTQPNLTEPFVAVADLIESVLSQDDFVEEEGLDLTQPNLTEAFVAAAPDLIESVLSEDDFVPEEGLDLSLASPPDDAPILFLGSEITTLDAEDDFVSEEGIDLSLAFPPDNPPPPITDLDPAIIALDAEDDFVEETGLDLAIDLPPDVPPPSVRRGVGYFKRPYKEIFRAIEKLAPWVPQDPAIARAVENSRDAVALVAGTTADSDAPAGGLLQLHRTPPDLSAMTRALGAAARASTLANKVRHAQIASMHAQAVLQRLKQAEEDEDEEDALCLLIY